MYVYAVKPLTFKDHMAVVLRSLERQSPGHCARGFFASNGCINTLLRVLAHPTGYIDPNVSFMFLVPPHVRSQVLLRPHENVTILYTTTDQHYLTSNIIKFLCGLL